MHVVLMVAGGETVCHVINQGFCKHTESPTQNGLIRIHGLVWFFSQNFCFHLRTIINYNFIVIGGFLFSALFLSRLVILLVSVHSNSLLITCEVHRYGIEGELHDERFNPGAATPSVAVLELSVLGHRDFQCDSRAVCFW